MKRTIDVSDTALATRRRAEASAAPAAVVLGGRLPGESVVMDAVVCGTIGVAGWSPAVKAATKERGSGGCVVDFAAATPNAPRLDAGVGVALLTVFGVGELLVSVVGAVGNVSGLLIAAGALAGAGEIEAPNRTMAGDGVAAVAELDGTANVAVVAAGRLAARTTVVTEPATSSSSTGVVSADVGARSFRIGDEHELLRPVSLVAPAAIASSASAFSAI
jgi:hypothetical protein